MLNSLPFDSQSVSATITGINKMKITHWPIIQQSLKKQTHNVHMVAYSNLFHSLFTMFLSFFGFGYHIRIHFIVRNEINEQKP